MKTVSIHAYVCCIAVLLGVHLLSAGPKSGVGSVAAPERRTWKDDTTGYIITQWTSGGRCHHPYFTVDPFIDAGHTIIFSDRTGRDQLYILDLATGTMTQMTDVRDLNEKIDHLPQYSIVWYLDGKKLYSLNTATFRADEVFDFSASPFTVQSFSVTCDARRVVFSAEKKSSESGPCGYGPFAVYTLDLRTKMITQITMDLGLNISHVQANPVDPTLVLYCWQWEKFNEERLVGHAPVRTWWVTIDGTDGGPVAQEFGTQRTHEAWTADGKSVTFVSKYRWTEKKGKHFMGIQGIRDAVPHRYWEQVSPGHSLLFRDGRHWVVDMFDNDEGLLALFQRGDSAMVRRSVLFRHASTLVGQSSHPHPRFSPDGKYVLFSTDRSGQPQVYTVTVDIGTSHEGNK